MSDLDLHFDTQRRGHQGLQQYDINVVLVPFEHLRMLSQRHEKRRVEVIADRRLTNDGKADAIEKSRAETRAAIREWHEGRLKSLDADLLEQRAGLMANQSVPDAKRVELMSSHLMKFKPNEIVVLYSSAGESERREIEAASAAIGRVPQRAADGGLEWTRLLDPEVAAEAILTRAETTNPTAAQKVRELTEIRAMQVTLTGVALSEI
jgi:hypothetical protein